MAIFSLYIINKAGGLVYHHNLSPGLARITSNDALILAGTIHGVFAIASKITPTALKVTQPQNSSLGGNANAPLSNNASILSSYARSNGGGVVATSSTGGAGSNTSSNTSGLKSVETDKFSMYVFQTLTGLKFLLVTSPGGPMNSGGSNTDINRGGDVAESVLRRVYSLYSDYVMKNPFYEVDMPIRVDLFDQKITELVKTLS